MSLHERYPSATRVTGHDGWAIAIVGTLMVLGCVLPWFRVQGAAREAVIGAPGAAKIACGMTLVGVAGAMVAAARFQRAMPALRSFVAAMGAVWLGTVIGCIALAEVVRAIIDPEWLPTSLRRLFFGVTPAWGVTPILLAAALMAIVGTYGGATGADLVQRTTAALRRGDRTVWTRSLAAGCFLVLAWVRYQPWERLSYGSQESTLSVWTVPWVGPFFSIVLVVGLIALVGMFTPLRRPSSMVLVVVGWLVSLYGAIFILIGMIPDVHLAGSLARHFVRWERRISAYAGTDVSTLENGVRIGVGAAAGAVVAFTAGCLLILSALGGLARTRAEDLSS